jgi:hypothetical protein
MLTPSFLDHVENEAEVEAYVDDVEHDTIVDAYFEDDDLPLPSLADVEHFGYLCLRYNWATCPYEKRLYANLIHWYFWHKCDTEPDDHIFDIDMAAPPAYTHAQTSHMMVVHGIGLPSPPTSPVSIPP